MKSYLLVLLLALPPLILSLLAAETAAPVGSANPAKLCSSPASVARPPAATATKPAASPRESTKVENRNPS
jgi:hypothetical protein